MRKLTAVALAAGVTLTGAGLYGVAVAAGVGPEAAGPMMGEGPMMGGDGPMMADRGGHHAEHRRFGHRRMGRDDDNDRGRRMGRDDDDDHGRRGMRGRGGSGGQEFGMRMFDRLDADDNGTVTREEAAGAMDGRGNRLASLDTDKDGTVTGAEIDAWLQGMKTSVLERMDANGDGQIDDSDRTAMMDKHFARLDGDSNGEITRDEARKVMRDWMQERRDGLRELRRRFWQDGDR
jgi:hypothetical protein